MGLQDQRMSDVSAEHYKAHLVTKGLSLQYGMVMQKLLPQLPR